MPPRRNFRDTYSPPRKDSARAIADAVQFLCGARSIDATTPEWVANRFRLSPKQAELLLIQARQRRGRGR